MNCKSLILSAQGQNELYSCIILLYLEQRYVAKIHKLVT